MRQNRSLLRGIVASATHAQRAAVHRLPQDFRNVAAQRSDQSPATTAWYVVEWLRRLGQNPMYWSRDRWRGRVVHESDVAREVALGRNPTGAHAADD